MKGFLAYKGLLIYIFWTLIVLVFVFTSVAVPVALSKAQEKETLNKVFTLQADEDTNYLSQAVSFEERVNIFCNADINIKSTRSAYSSELSIEEVIKKINDYLPDWIDEFNSEIYANLGLPTVAADTLLSYAMIDAVLYESPSGSTKIPYWRVTYQWEPYYNETVTMKNWPIYFLEIYCDTLTGNPYCISYYYSSFIHFSESCGVSAYAKTIGLEDKLNITEAEQYFAKEEVVYDTSEKSSATIINNALNLFFPLEEQGFGIVKSINILGENWDRIQFIPNDMVE